MSADQWAGILKDGEDILWQGKPEQAFALTNREQGTAAMAILFLLLLTVGQRPSEDQELYLKAMFFLLAGTALWALFGSSVRARFTWYTLTNKRAIIATAYPLMNKRLKSYAIRANSPAELIVGKKGVDSVVLALEERTDHHGHIIEKEIGFERIRDADQVIKIVTDLKRRAA